MDNTNTTPQLYEEEYANEYPVEDNFDGGLEGMAETGSSLLGYSPWYYEEALGTAAHEFFPSHEVELPQPTSFSGDIEEHFGEEDCESCLELEDELQHDDSTSLTIAPISHGSDAHTYHIDVYEQPLYSAQPVHTGHDPYSFIGNSAALTSPHAVNSTLVNTDVVDQLLSFLFPFSGHHHHHQHHHPLGVGVTHFAHTGYIQLSTFVAQTGYIDVSVGGQNIRPRQTAFEYVESLQEVSLDDIPADSNKCPHCWLPFGVTDEDEFSFSPDEDTDTVAKENVDTLRILPFDRSKPSNDPVRTPCGHVFGRTCLIESLEKVNWLCPMCKADLNPAISQSDYDDYVL